MWPLESRVSHSSFNNTLLPNAALVALCHSTVSVRAPIVLRISIKDSLLRASYRLMKSAHRVPWYLPLPTRVRRLPSELVRPPTLECFLWLRTAIRSHRRHFTTIFFPGLVLQSRS